MKKLYILLVAFLCLTSSFAQTTILAYGSDWKYLDNGSNQGTAWREINFPDDTWSSGKAELGYGDGDEATIVSYGTSKNHKYVTTYFRKTLTINNSGSFSGFILAIKRDDGAVVYVNGKEVFRSNMPGGNITSSTRASAKASDDGETAKTISLTGSTFVTGENTIAVEIHQFRTNEDDKDISFDLKLEGIVQEQNTPPVANAGSDQTIILPVNSTTLDGSATVDPDGSISTYLWTQVSGPSSGTISNPGNVSTSVTTLVEGTYTFQLTVTDNDNATSTDDVSVTVAEVNNPPVANAGTDQTITLPTNSVALNGSGSSDIDGTIDFYDWTQVSGPSSATIGSPENVTTSITGLVAGTYTFRLEVTDDDDDANTDDVVVTVKSTTNTPPIAKAGPNQDITPPNNSVTLDGTGSSDADGIITAYAWTIFSGPSSVTIADPGNAVTTVTGLVSGIYTFRLLVTDNEGATKFNDMLVTVNGATNNKLPEAVAGPNFNITLPTNSVTLDGSNSGDADGTITNYSWTKVSGPSTFTITSPGNVSTTVTGLVAGTYVFRLTVTDNDGAIDANEMRVTVYNATNNTPPSANPGPDQTIILPTNSVTLNGSNSSDADGTITAYEWIKISGPSSYTINTPNNVSTTVTGLVAGTYTFRLTVTDNDGATDAEDMLVTVNAPTSNTPPSANAGSDQTITLPTNSVSLNGNGSNDADGTITSYVWTKISGPSTFTITSPDNVSTTVTGLVAGTYTFRITVTDNVGAADTDDMVVTVNAAPNNTPPNASAGPDQTITLPTSSITLDGSNSSDADGTITVYAWTMLSGPSSGTITNPGSVTTTVTGLVAGTYTFRLTVTDNDGANDTNDMIVTVKSAANNTPPNASAGPDQTITLPTNSVTLNGSNSSDADGTITNYAWAKVSGPSTFTITSPGNVSTTVTGLVAGTYTFRLTVTDNDGATDTNDMIVTVNSAANNTPPNASAGPDQTITLPTNSVTLNGSNSSDADGTITNYAWTKVSGPSTFTITSPGNVSTTVTGLVAGTYTFRLTVTDNDGATDANDMVVTVNAAPSNTPPNASAGPDQTITLPTNSVTLNGSGSSDADGTITDYAWTKVSGPSTFTITSPGNVSTTVTGLVAGTYTFRLTVTDNDGATDADDVTVTVSSVTLSTLTRGPYLQMANGSAVTLRWRTDVATNSKISVGTSLGTYTTSATNNTSTTEHEVRITGLSADTKYYYSFGSSTETLQSGSANFFTTAPPASTTRKIRVAAFGDCGRNDNGFQSGSLSSYQAYVGSNPAELMLLLGDNAYDAGTDGQYTSGFFSAYSSSILKNHVLFPAPGNHDYANSSSRQSDHNIPYYNIFTLPENAECGGVASGTEAFYSYNWGNIHFLSLDSYGYESGSTRLYDTSGPQVTWVKKDLAANTSKWTIVYWHHPPYTMGSHNSDSESELVKMRQNFIRILERYGVDMVMCGHSHDYERSYLLKGYFGNEASFDVNTSAVTSSKGFYDGSANSCPYNLKSGQVNHGTVYVVSGSAGADGSVQSGYPHNALPFAVDDGGLFYFEVENNRLDAKFIRKDGVIADKFTIMKDAGQTRNITISSGQSATLTASWKGNYSWSNGANTQSITVSPTSTTSYTCTDGNSCITDNFTVNIGSPLRQVTLAPSDESYTLNAYPTPIKKGAQLTITTENTGLHAVNIFNDKGQKVKQLSLQGSTRMSTTDMRPGIYYLRTEIGGKKMVKKIMVIE